MYICFCILNSIDISDYPELGLFKNQVCVALTSIKTVCDKTRSTYFRWNVGIRWYDVYRQFHFRQWCINIIYAPIVDSAAAVIRGGSIGNTIQFQVCLLPDFSVSVFSLSRQIRRILEANYQLIYHLLILSFYNYVLVKIGLI